VCECERVETQKARGMNSSGFSRIVSTGEV
jgi:hypothetical protein